jgi:hypothetical protein
MAVTTMIDITAAGEILHELHTVKIGVSLTWHNDGVVFVQLLDRDGRVLAAESFPGGVVVALEWLRDAAYYHYHECDVFPDGYCPDGL